MSKDKVEDNIEIFLTDKLDGKDIVTKYNLEEYNEICVKKGYPQLTNEMLEPYIQQYRTRIKNGPIKIQIRQGKSSNTQKISNVEKFLAVGGISAHMAHILEGVNHSFVSFVGLVGFAVGSNIIHQLYNPEKSLKKAKILTLGSAGLFIAASHILPSGQAQVIAGLGASYGIGAGLIGFANNLLHKEDKKNKIK